MFCLQYAELLKLLLLTIAVAWQCILLNLSQVFRFSWLQLLTVTVPMDGDASENTQNWLVGWLDTCFNTDFAMP